MNMIKNIREANQYVASRLIYHLERHGDDYGLDEDERKVIREAVSLQIAELKNKIDYLEKTAPSSPFLYRAVNFALFAIPIIGETLEVVYTKDQQLRHENCTRNACFCRLLPKRITRDSFVSTNKEMVLDWLKNRRKTRLQNYSIFRQNLIELDLQSNLIYKLQLSREENWEIEYHNIVPTNCKATTIKTETMRETPLSNTKMRRVNLYIVPKKYKIADYWAQLVFGTWIIKGLDSQKRYDILDWVDKRMRWLNEQKFEVSSKPELSEGL